MANNQIIGWYPIFNLDMRTINYYIDLLDYLQHTFDESLIRHKWCNFCRDTVHSEDELIAHGNCIVPAGKLGYMYNSDGTNTFICLLCNQNVEAADIREHSQSHLLLGKFYALDRIGEQKKIPQYVEPVYEEIEEPIYNTKGEWERKWILQCQFCSFKCDFKYRMRNHHNTAHPRVPRFFRIYNWAREYYSEEYYEERPRAGQLYHDYERPRFRAHNQQLVPVQ